MRAGRRLTARAPGSSMRCGMAQRPPVIYVSTMRRRRSMWPAALTATLVIGVVAVLVIGLA